MHPVLVLPLNEGSGDIVYDRSGYNNHGTIYSATWIKRWRDWFLEFDILDDYVIVPHSNSLDLRRLTVCAWMYPIEYITDVSKWCEICAKRKGRIWAPDYAGWVLRGYYRSGTGAVGDICAFTVSDGVSNGGVNFSLADLGITASEFWRKWYFCCGIYDGSIVKARLYSPFGTFEKQTSISVDIRNTYDVVIGANSNLGDKFRGIIGEVMIFRNILTTEQLDLLASMFRGELRSPPTF